MNDFPELLTVKETAAYLRVSKSTIYRLLERGKLPGAFRIGSDWRMNRDVLDRALDNQQAEAAEPAKPRKMRVAR